jgi:hypothetical protein
VQGKGGATSISSEWAAARDTLADTMKLLAAYKEIGDAKQEARPDHHAL